MTCFLDISNSKYRSLVKLDNNLTKLSNINVRDTLISFNSDNLFTESIPASIGFAETAHDRINNNIIANEDVVMRIGYYQQVADIRHCLGEGIACIRVKGNNSTEFTIDGTTFVVTNPETEVAPYKIRVNLGATIVDTSNNISIQINRYCTRVKAKAMAEYLLITRAYDNNLSGYVPRQFVMHIPTMPNTLKFSLYTVNSEIYEFIGTRNGEESTDAGYTQHFTISDNYSETIQSLQRAFCRVKKLGFCDYNNTDISIYCSDIVTNMDDFEGILPQDVDELLPNAGTSGLIAVDDINLTLTKFVNLDASEDKSLVAQIATALYETYPSQINGIVFSGKSVNIQSGDFKIDINNFAGCIFYDYVDYEPSLPILNNCAEYLSNSVNNITGCSASVYIDGCSVEVQLDADTIETSSAGISIYRIGTSEYPSSEESPMSMNDIEDYLNNTYDDVDLVVFKSDSSIQASTIELSNITRSFRLYVTTKGYVDIDKDLFKFNHCTSISVTLYKSRWITTNTSHILYFNECNGNLYFENSEFLISDNSGVLYNKECVNFETDVKFCSFLVGSKNTGIQIFSFNNDYSELNTYGNVFDKQYSDGSVTIYAFNGTSGRVSVSEKYFKDVIRGSEVSMTYYTPDYVKVPYAPDPSLITDKKIICGLDVSYNDNVADKDRLREWSFNLTADSIALDVVRERTDITDINGNKRYLDRVYGKSILKIPSATAISVTGNDFFVVNNVRYYFDLDVSLGNINNERLAKVMVAIISKRNGENSCYEVDGNNVNFIVTSKLCDIQFCYRLAQHFHVDESCLTYETHNGIVISGEIDSIGINKPDSPIYQAIYVVDFGSRQKHCTYDEVRYVDSLGNSIEERNYRAGTEDDKFFCQDMIEYIKSSYPRFGDTKFILSGKSNEAQQVASCDLSKAICSDSSNESDCAKLYGNVCLTSTFRGIREVPVFIAETNDIGYLFKLGCYGDAYFTFDNILVATSSSMLVCEERPETSIMINNCVLKSFSGTIITSNVCKLSVFESTLIGFSSPVVYSAGVVKFEANVYGIGNIDTNSINTVVNDFNYRITNASTNCLAPDALSQTFSAGIKIEDFYPRKTVNNPIVNLIPNIYALSISIPTMNMDIGGRYRCNDSYKVSLDAGAIESEAGLVNTEIVSYYVNLSDTEVTNSGDARYISWLDFKNKMESLTEIHKNYLVYLSGYAINAEPLIIDEDVAFYEQASIKFIAEKDCVYEGTSFIDVRCDYANVSVEGLTARVTDSFIKAANYSNVSMIDCFLISKNSESPLTSLVFGDECIVSMLTCSMLLGINVTALSVGSNPTAYCIGCVIQGVSNNAIGIDMSSVTISSRGKLFCNNVSGTNNKCTVSNSALLNVDLCSISDILYSKDSKLLSEEGYEGFAIVPEDLDNEGLVEVFREALALDWNRDIDNNVRKLSLNPLVVENDLDDVYTENRLFCSPGCYNSIAVDSDGVFLDTPNREITCITEIGRTMITKMISNIVRFKIEGFAICSDGYDYNNPVMSIKSEFNIVRERIRITAKTNVFSSVVVKIGTTEFRYGTDFDGNNKKSVMTSLANAINKVHALSGSSMNASVTFGATVVDANNGVIELNKIMPKISDAYADSSSEITFDSTHFNVEVLQHSSDYNPSNCLKNQAYPNSGILNFDSIEYLPMALSMYYRIDRSSWCGGFGSEVVLARVTECPSDNSLVDYVFPLCVCHHGLITKGRDSFVTGRIVLQL